MLTYQPPILPVSAAVIDLCGLPLSRFTTVTKSRLFGGGSFNLHSMDWSDDGMHMYAGLLAANQVRNFKSSGNPWEIDEQDNVGLMRPESFTDAEGVKVRPDGMQLWVIANTGLGAGRTLSYSLSTPYEWIEGEPSLLSSVNNSRSDSGATFNSLNDLNISPDGTKLITGYVEP